MLPTENGAYVVVFQGRYGTVSTHSVDLFEGHWWDGREIVSEEYIEKELIGVTGTMYKAELIPLA